MENTPLEAAALKSAFLATTYRVITPSATFNLRISQPDLAFELFLRKWRAANWGVITACNPGGRFAPSPEANDRATKQLAMRIRENGWLGFPSINHADGGDWPDEPGYCVLNAGDEALCRIAQDFSQAAIVYGEAGGGGGRLIWMVDRMR